MRIAFIDNMNNAFFSLAKHLSAEGICCHVYTLPVETHAAVSDTSASQTHEFLLKRFPFQPNLATWVTYRTVDFRSALGFLDEYDCIVACGWAVAFLTRAGITIDIIIPYGDDVDGIFIGQKLYPNFPIEAIDSFIAHQAKGLRSATCIVYHSSCDGLRALDIPYISATIPRIFSLQRLSRNFGSENRPIEVISTTRHLWSSDLHVSEGYFSEFGGFKRNDFVIRAFARLLRDNPRMDIILTLSSVGPSFKDSLELIEGLGIKNQIRSLTHMSRSELWRRISMADICVDAPQVGYDHSHSWLSDTMEGAFFSETALIGRMENEALKMLHIPMISAVTEDDIYAALKVLVENPALRRLLGEASHEWRTRNIVRPAVNAFVDLFTHYKRGIQFDAVSAYLLTIPAAQIVRPK